MTWPQAIIVYFVCWWLFLFMALPFGVRPQQAPEPGVERAAPEKTYLGIKCTIVTVLAAGATWAIDIVIATGIVPVK
jgi:predicted secreted protein